MRQRSTDTQAVDALARQRLLPFVMMVFAQINPGKPPLRPTWYLKAICYLLERATRGEVRRHMVWLMPRALKSITMAVAWPCWLHGQNPACHIMVAAYSAQLSREHAERRAEIMRSDWYRRLFPGTRIKTDRAMELETMAGGKCLAISVDGTITGRGADFIILDDVAKASCAHSEADRLAVKNWSNGTINSRFDDPANGVIISMQQRLHEDDLPAHLLTKNYGVLYLPAVADRDQRIEIGPGRFHDFRCGELLDPIRFPQAVLDEKRFEMGPQSFSAQYLQTPISPEGNLFRMEHFKRFDKPISRERFEKVIQSWDTAQSELPTADWTVGLTFGLLAGRLFLLEIYRGRPTAFALRELIIAKRKLWRADYVLIEQANMGYDLCREFRRTGPFQPRGIQPILNKVGRATGQAGQIEEGRLYLPTFIVGIDSFLSEVRAFPTGKHDDQVDAMTQALEFAQLNWKSLAQERTASGRVQAVIRGARPALEPLPDWVLQPDKAEPKPMKFKPPPPWADSLR